MVEEDFDKEIAKLTNEKAIYVGTKQQWMQSSEGGKWSSNSAIILQGIKLSSDLFWSKPPRTHVCDDACFEIKDLKGVTAVSCYGKATGDPGTLLPGALVPRTPGCRVWWYGHQAGSPGASGYVGCTVDFLPGKVRGPQDPEEATALNIWCCAFIPPFGEPISRHN